MKKYQLTEDMVHDRKYWPDVYKEMVKKGDKGDT